MDEICFAIYITICLFQVLQLELIYVFSWEM